MTWMITPSFGVEYGADFLEPGNPGGWSESLKTFDEEWTTSPGDTVYVDIWINDVPEKLITSGFMLTYDSSQMEILGADVYDGTVLTGSWDSDMTNKVANPSGPGTYMVIVGNLSGVLPDASRDIPIARIKVVCGLSGDASMTLKTVTNFDTVVGNSAKVYDFEITPNTIIISPGQGPSSTTTCPENTICIRCPSEAIYGKHSSETELLHNFRDNALSKTPEGRALIKLYYLWSPVIVKTMEEDEGFKAEIKGVIDSVLPMIEKMVE
jgi:hypothetical protein